ncbi:DUF790 family protein, partial [bacterium]|nr:DUF790 family protein [bacterium]
KWDEKINPKVVQGMARILFNRAVFLNFGEDDPQETREQVFSASAAYWSQSSNRLDDFREHKGNILKSLDIHDPEKLNNTDSWLFGDVTSNQKLTSFDKTSSEKLIHRFNIEQVQGLLLYSQNLELKIKKDENSTLRQIMQMMKFFRLMFDVKETDKNWVTLHIDGPGAVLENSRSYGMEIAQFFPAILLLTTPFELTAILKVPNRSSKFSLKITDKNSYQTYYVPRGIWKHEKILSLVERFNSKYAGEYHASAEQEIITLKDNTYLLPDLFIAVDPNLGKSIRVEWIHYFSDSRRRWLHQIYPELPDNYVFAVKGKKTKLKSTVHLMKKQLLIFSNELTAPALRKKIEEFN